MVVPDLLVFVCTADCERASYSTLLEGCAVQGSDRALGGRRLP